MRPRAATVVVALILAACAPPPSTGPGQVATSTEIRTDAAGNVVGTDDLRPTGPLTDLEACGDPPPAGPDAAPDGLFLPPGTIVEKVDVIDPVVSVEAWAPMTPSQIRRSFEAASGYEVLNREDETYDAEVLVTDGDERSFVEVLAICDRASRFLVVTSAEAEP